MKEDEPEVIEVRVWNDTVANLTLMALGTSAPEILLSVIEIVGHGFESGKLGPATIVGSAAFNLLIITSVCMLALPLGDIRRIQRFKVSTTVTGILPKAFFWRMDVSNLMMCKLCVKILEALRNFENPVPRERTLIKCLE